MLRMPFITRTKTSSATKARTVKGSKTAKHRPSKFVVPKRLHGFDVRNLVGRTTLMAVVLLLVAGSAGFVGGWLAGNQEGFTASSLSDQKKIVTNEGELISAITEEVGPSVV